MAGGSQFVWIPLLLCCVFKASESHDIWTVKGPRSPHNTDGSSILSQIPITLPEGINPSHVNITSIIVKTCTGVRERLSLLSTQLQHATVRNIQLDNEAFGLRSDVRLLKLQLAACSSTASAITGSYQAQLTNKMKQLLETFDSDTFLILKIIALTREVNTLEKRLKHAANSTENSIEIRVLQRELEQKVTELTGKKDQLGRSLPNSSLIFQIIALQNQIWDMEQAQSRRPDTSPLTDKRIMALQTQLDTKITQLRSTGHPDLVVVELISVHSKITTLQRLINTLIEESRTTIDGYQQQMKLKTELLKKKILELTQDENNSELTKEILKLQTEEIYFSQLILNVKRTSESSLRNLRTTLEEEKKRENRLEKQLEETDFAQAQLIIQIINVMKEVRELEGDEEEQVTSTSHATTLQTLLQDKEREYAQAQAEIKELEKKLQLKSQECSGFQERHELLKAEFEQKIAELNRTGDFEAALILNVINLFGELRDLKEQIVSTDDVDRFAELQRQLEEKQDALLARTTEIKREIPNPKIILTIIELQDEIWDLQGANTNGSNSNRIKQLQNRVDDLINQIVDKDDGNTKRMLKIITLQSEVRQLEKELSDLKVLETTEATRLRDDLTAKQQEVQKYLNELNEKNQENARLIVTVTQLHSELKNLENERYNDNMTSLATITQLTDQLKAKIEEHARDRADIQALQTLLLGKERELTTAQTEVRELQKKLGKCSGLKETYEQIKTKFIQKTEELKGSGETQAALILHVINLHDDLRKLRDLIAAAKDPDRLTELLNQLEQKQDQLIDGNADIEREFANPGRIRNIIDLLDAIGALKMAANYTNYDGITELQNRADDLISQIDERGIGNTKLMLKIITLQSQVEHLNTQLSDSRASQIIQASSLINDLNSKRKELQKYINELNGNANAQLILTVTDLYNQLRSLEQGNVNEGQASSTTITELREQLKEKVEEHARDRAEIEALQKQLNETEDQCSSTEQKLQDVHKALDAKLEELQSTFDTVTSLALTISTITLQLEELKKQQRKTESENKIKELQKLIDEKNKELAKKTEELNENSAQPQRILHIIAVQTEIDNLADVAANDTDYKRLKALEDHLNYLIAGVQDENNENTRLMFQILSQREEIARLKKQKERQTKEELEKINDLDNELQGIRNQIEEKTKLLEIRDSRISNLTAQIMELHRKIRPLEKVIADLKEANAENLDELQKRLDLSKKQLQDSELQLSQAAENNYNLIREIIDLREKLKQAEQQSSQATQQITDDLERQILTLQRRNRILEKENTELKEEERKLNLCCNDANNHCTELEAQLQQNQNDADRLQQQLQVKDIKVKQLEQALDEQIRENNRLQNENDALKEKLAEVEDNTIYTTKMTFDRSTANQRIVLSADNTEMCIGTGISGVSRRPGQFDVLLAVLGKPGFSSGRHYWEVSVAGKLCYHLGMASESAQRWGAVTISPANGFWTIVLNKQGQYRAIDRRAVIIPVNIRPLTLGILLDYKKGQISFYDAGARSHMYTFVGQVFTDKIFPFINFCVEDDDNHTPIVLLTPGATDWIQ